MIHGESLKNLMLNGGQRDPGRFVRHIYQGLGLADANGRRHLTPAGNPDWSKVLEARRNGGYLPEEFSLRELAEVTCGEHWQRKMNPDSMARAAILEAERPLLEAGTGAVTPSDFIDVNALTAAVTGLYEVALLEGFNHVDFIGDKLAPTDPTKVFGGKKVIGAGGMGNVAEIRQPGMPTKRAGLTERWINTPPTNEHAIGIEILYETLYLDLTGDVTSKANDGGYWIGYQREIRIIDCFLGVPTAMQYNYKGNTYNTYIANGYYNNKITGNELLHESNVEQIMLMFREMLDPETNTRVTIQPEFMLVNREKLRTANAIMGTTADSTQYRDTGSAPYINQSRPFYTSQFTILESPLVYGECVSPTGLNLSATNAGKQYWMFSNKNGGFCRYSQNWPLRVQQATPTQMDMIDRGVALFIKADERGEPYIREPRKSVWSGN